MTFRVIEGGKDAPVTKGGLVMVDATNLDPAEAARAIVIDRVADAIWEAERDGSPDIVGWADYVRRAYAEAENDPSILADVSARYRSARAALAALKPPEPDFDEGIAVRAFANYPVSVVEMLAITQQVTDWIDEVLK